MTFVLNEYYGMVRKIKIIEYRLGASIVICKVVRLLNQFLKNWHYEFLKVTV